MNVKELNRASVQELERIQGIGHERAEDIVSFREEHGGFKNVEELKKIPGFNNEMMEQVKSGDAEGGEADKG